MRRIHRLTAPVLMGLVGAIVALALGPGIPGSSAVERELEAPLRMPPPWLELSAEESALWTEQGVHQPADHLLGTRVLRAANRVTPLRVAVVLVEFADQLADRDLHHPAYYEQLLFSRNELPGGSVADYFATVSQGRLELTGDVVDWVMMPREKESYTANRGGIGFYPLNSQKLAEEAIKLADGGINYALLDNEGADQVPDSGDDDELIDGVLIMHAGIGREGGSTPNDFISVHWWTQSNVPVDGVFGRFFTLTPEAASVGLIAHELGHLLGLPDLYDTDGGSAGLGRWSLMASGHLLEGGDRPADLDAWSKVELGFADVNYLVINERDLRISPVAQTGHVYRAWRGGLGSSEYFLIENRPQTGVDAALPGGGLLVYHVDERITGNTSPNHYKVALEQADGQFHLENRFNAINLGDPGDPFRGGDVFSRYSTPSSHDYEGDESNIALFNIRGPEPDGAFLVDINTQSAARVDVVDVTLEELVGDGDGIPEPGEELGVVPRMEVSNAPAVNLTLAAESLDPRGILMDGTRDLGRVEAGQSITLAQPIRVALGPDLPSDPYGLRMRLTVSWDGYPSRQVPLELGIGTQVGREDEFDVAQTEWTHDAIYPTRLDTWYYTPDQGVAGTGAFRAGRPPAGFRRNVDAVLESPPILLPPGAELAFDQRVEIPFSGERVLAGGHVEISINGGDWQDALPVGGYPHFMGGSSLEWVGRQVYAGTVQGGEWHTARIDLSQFTGLLRVRFRFYSEFESSEGLGWLVDNVAVHGATTPVRVLSVDHRVRDRDVALTWRLADPLPSVVRWIRGEDPATGHVVGSGWRRALDEDTVIDEGGANHLPARYWLEGLERDGSVSRFGPYAIDPAVASRPWHVVRNPFRGDAEFRWAAPPPEGATLEIFDVSGRLVRSVRLAGRPDHYRWSGQTDGGVAAAPGIYFARVSGTSLGPIRLVRLP